jgi:cell division protein FtsI (penicillin-binding protein 3)
MTKTQKSRMLLIFLCFITLYMLITLHLYRLQIYQHAFFNTLATQQYQGSVIQQPPRAEIYDRNGQPLALNKDSLAAFVIPNTLTLTDTLSQFLKNNFPQALDRLIKNKKSPFMYLQRRLSNNKVLRITNAKLEPIHLLKEPSRFYPLDCASPLIGITDIDNHGIFGLELQYEKQLSGSPTTFFLEKDARSGHFYFKKETKVQGQEGSPLYLTLDSTLQFLAHEELMEAVKKFGSTEGSIIIMDPATGDILSMATYPSFDPHATQTLDLEKTKNKVLTEVYELGSVMKIFAALAALEEKVVTPDELIDCENTLSTVINRVRINTVKPNGRISFEEVIELSNNIGSAKVALRVGPKLYDHYKKCGFGKKTNIPFPAEQSGFINPPHKWTAQSPMSLSFGYEVSATLLQLACAFCMIANNGIPVQPRLILNQPVKFLAKKPLYSPETMSIIHSILQKTVTQGTAKKADMHGYVVKGKTGTANLLVDGHYAQDHNIFTFSGIIEKVTTNELLSPL